MSDILLLRTAFLCLYPFRNNFKPKNISCIPFHINLTMYMQNRRGAYFFPQYNDSCNRLLISLLGKECYPLRAKKGCSFFHICYTLASSFTLRQLMIVLVAYRRVFMGTFFHILTTHSGTHFHRHGDSPPPSLFL